MYHDRKRNGKPNSEPPCSTCIPATLPNNQPAIDVLNVCQYQFVNGMMGEPVDLDTGAIERAMHLVGIPEAKWVEVFRKVQAAGREMLRMMRENINEHP